jgi:glycosyltransferase involved in cell wall biosynthesis
MKLCVISPYPPELNGIGEYAWSVVHGLADTGSFSAITVLAQRPEAKVPIPFMPLRSNGARHPVVRARYLWSRDEPLAAAWLARAIRAERPDAIWLNLDFTMFGASRPANFLGLLAPLVARRSGRPLVVTLHQILEATPPRSIGAKNGVVTHWGLRTATQLLLRADAVCVTLRSYERTLRMHYGARNVHHIPHGAFGALEYLPYPTDDQTDDILFFGFAAPFKGLTTLLDAYALLQRRRPQVSLTIAGPDHKRFPGYLAGLQAAMRAHNGSGPTIQPMLDRVRWLGPQTEAQLREVFARARVVVLPYTATTGSSSVLHRAAAVGRPVLASDLPDLRAAAEEEGLLAGYVPPSDPRALADALEALLADRPRQAAWAQHNLAMMRNMTLDQTCARYLELFAGSCGASA